MLGLLLAIGCDCSGQEIRLNSAGARFGFSPEGAGSGFRQAEAFVNWDLPWDWDLGAGWRLGSRLDASAGWIGDSSVNAGVFTLGPTLMLRPPSFPLSFEVGFSPTVLTQDNFPSKNFGIPFQFTSHAGINYDMTAHFRIGYRFQHMSNADLSRHNPGLNLHMFALSYLF